MRVELKNDNPQFQSVIQEAEEILERLSMHQGTFEYWSQIRMERLKLIIRPMTGDIVNGQPSAHQYSDLLLANVGYIARFHH